MTENCPGDWLLPGNLEYVSGRICTMRWCTIMTRMQKSLPH